MQCSWGEFTPSLEDVCNIMRIPIVGDGNPFKIELDREQKKKLQVLEKGAYDSKEVFLFCNWQRVFPLAIMLAAGTCFPLAPLFLSHLYRKLDQISKDDKEGAGQYGIDSLVSSFFLQLFVWERFKGLAVEPVTPKSLHQLEGGKRDFNLVGFPLCCRWFRRKVKKGAFRPAILDDIGQFNFRPYFTAHGFQTFPFFYPEGNSSLFLGSVELLLATNAQTIIAYGDFFDLAIEIYSPHRVKRQFGIDQDVPSHLSYDGHLRNCIMDFTRTYGISCSGILFDSLRKKDSVSSPTLTFLRFWELQRCEFRRFIKTGGTRL
ncbi:uncharacterized protein LOC133730452 [Rosa rugosa]|uniref:uncharacterized protein LOC133730452 n=1 Tax=Rosa rugosa TaxID=74645 RepID=UPI002B40ECE2|nr:uncharacterized protein LOC133730452 [Rosa rugosa]